MPPHGASPADGPASCGRQHLLKTTDFDVLAAALGGWELEFQQLGRGTFLGEAHQVQVGGISVLRLSANRVIQARGTHRPGGYAFAPILPTNERATWRGRRLKPGQINVNPPSGVVDHLTSADYSLLNLDVDVETFQTSAEVLCGPDLGERLAGGKALSPAPDAFAALEASLRQLLVDALAHPALLESPEACKAIEQTCVGQLLRAITSADLVGGAPVTVGDREPLVRRAEELMLAHLDRPLHVEEICAELGVSERTLRYAFHDLFGLSPMAYFKAKRLNAVRHQFKRAGPEAPSVHVIAERWGFAHTGGFAADYRRLFGELPSAALGASPTYPRPAWARGVASQAPAATYAIEAQELNSHE
jgi:AraC family ethanolamine operon transcriptional activator